MKSTVGIACVLVLAVLVATPAQAQEQAFIDSMFAVERIEAVVYGSGWIENPWPQEFDLLLDLYHPIGEGIPEVLPGYVIIHGGAFWTGSRNEFDMIEMATQMAGRGYVAVSVDYRLDGQLPVPSSEFVMFTQSIGNTISAASEDCTNAYRWLIDHADSVLADAGINAEIDPVRIATGGESAGASLAMIMAWILDDFMVTIAPPVPVVADFWGFIGDNYRGHMECGEAPFIILHGTEDNTVPFAHVYDLMAQADTTCAGVDTLGVYYELYPAVGQGHGFDYFTLEAAPDTTYFEKVVHFFYEQLDLANINPVAVSSESLPGLCTLTSYPNPFNPQTTISFALGRQQKTEIAVYDLSGRLLGVLADRTYDAGRHAVVWKGNDAAGHTLSSGTYVVRLKTASAVETKKITLVR